MTSRSSLWLTLLGLALSLGACIDPPTGQPSPKDMAADLDDTCQEEDASFCARLGASCGRLTGADLCGVLRTVSCPDTCAQSESCTSSNQCACQPQNDLEFCALRGATCGPLTGLDNCGSSRAVPSCGECQGNECTAGNTCVCTPKTDAELCTQARAVCGTIEVSDGCGPPREIVCGACANGAQCNSANTCGCIPESDEILCGRLELQCGALESELDNCGMTRSVGSCGSCMGQELCSETGTCPTCKAESELQFCARLGAQCGEITAANNCGVMKTADCSPPSGACEQGSTCVQNQCVCTAQSDAEFCSARGITCGELTGNDNCGMMRVDVDCGSCGAGERCNGARSACECAPESDAQFCASHEAVCGVVMAMDSCGVERTVNCGMCGAAMQCNQDNKCDCKPESDEQFCGRLGKQCGMVTAEDNCNVRRTGVSCGSCTQGSCLPDNTCSTCQAESDTGFCARLGKQCGAVMDADNCGDVRSVASCGSCQSGEMCQANQCECAPETDAQLCASISAECGEHLFTDRCSAARVVDCGGCAEYKNCIATGAHPTPHLCDEAFIENPVNDPDATYGHAVALHGRKAVAGVPTTFTLASGRAAYFKLDTQDQWIALPAITPTNGVKNLTFGYDVAIGEDTIVVGQPRQGNLALPTTDQGRTHYYTPGNPAVHVASLGSAALAGEGYSVAYVSSGAEHCSVSGAPFKDAAPYNMAISRTWTAATGVSSASEQLLAAASGQELGNQDVAVRETTLVVSAPGEDKLYVYTRATASAMWGTPAIITLPDSARFFGTTVALSPDEQFIAATSSTEEPFGEDTSSGPASVHLYKRGAGNTWSSARDYATTSTSNKRRFGRALAFLQKNTKLYLLIGNPKDGVYIVEKGASSWPAALPPVFTPPGLTPGDEFGWAIAAHEDRFMISAPKAGNANTTGRIYFFTMW